MFHVKHSTSNELIYNRIIDLLYEDNHHLNLSGIKEKQGMYEQHILDSKALSDFIKNRNNDAETIYDLGSGAGFPGLVIATDNSNKNVVMVDSNHKKTDFINKVVDLLGFKNVKVINSRIEEMGNTETADIVCAKALASLDILLEYASPLLKTKGILVAMKSCEIQEELANGLAVTEMLGFKKPVVVPYSLFNKQRQLLVFEKYKKAKIELPRKNGEAKNKPLRSKL